MLDLEPPQQDATGDEFDDAIQAKALQRDAARGKPDRERHTSFHDHPDERSEFNPDPQTNLSCASRSRFPDLGERLRH